MNQMPADFGSGKQIDLFSYAALSRADEAAAREDAALIKAHMKSAAESIIAVGLALKRQKERLPHGMFLPWIEAEFGMAERTGRRFMEVATAYASKSATVADLTPTALYELAAPSTPQPIRDEVEALLVDGQKVTTADIRKMKAEAKAKQASIEDLAARNTELAQRVVEPVQPTIDEDAIREEGRRDAGLSPDQAKQAIRVANVPAAEFERQVESPNPPTVTKLAEQGKQSAPAPAPKPAIVTTEDDLHAELTMIDENLCRNELSPAERASQTARRKAIYLELYPETAQHVAGGKARQETASDNLSFAAQTAKATGRAERTVQREAERGEKVIPEVIDMITGTKLDTGTYLDKLKKLPPNEQVTAAKRDLSISRQPATPKRKKAAPSQVSDAGGQRRRSAS